MLLKICSLKYLVLLEDGVKCSRNKQALPAIKAIASLISEEKAEKETQDYKQVLTQLVVQKLLSEDFKKHLDGLLCPDQVDNLDLLLLLCKLCEYSKPMCIAVAEHKSYLTALGKNFREVVTTSNSDEISDLEDRVRLVLVLWCILKYREQDISVE